VAKTIKNLGIAKFPGTVTIKLTARKNYIKPN
jgi:hypothetical protein